MKYIVLLGLALVIFNTATFCQMKDEPCICADGREGYLKTSIYDSYLFGGTGRLICICDFDSFRIR